jgi:hypothetical protein
MRESGSVDREGLAFGMAKLVQEWPASLDVTTQLLGDIKSWGGVKACRPELTLDFCTVWVEAFLREVWRSLYDLCRTAERETDQSKLTFLLGTLAYQHPNEHHLHVTLLAFAVCRQFAQLASPGRGELVFSYGDAPTEYTLQSLITSNAVRFKRPSEYDAMDSEQWTHELERVLQSQYKSRLEQQTKDCAAVLFSLRHQDHVPSQVLSQFNLLDKENLLSKLNDTFKHCYQNR